MLLIIILIAIAAMWMVILNSSSNTPQTNSTPVKPKYPISEEQKSIFEKNWTLPEFRKEFGKEFTVKDCHNNTTFVPYKCCIFVKGFFTEHKTWVRFASSLGELSEKEIERRKDELMVGFTGKNYVLYDSKIQKWECQEVDLGL